MIRIQCRGRQKLVFAVLVGIRPTVPLFFLGVFDLAHLRVMLHVPIFIGYYGGYKLSYIIRYVLRLRIHVGDLYVAAVYICYPSRKVVFVYGHVIVLIKKSKSPATVNSR